jgi:hypothetical protein
MDDSVFFFLELYYKEKTIEYADFGRRHLIDGFISNLPRDKNPVAYYTYILQESRLIEDVRLNNMSTNVTRITEVGEKVYLEEKKRREFETEKQKLEYDLAKITFQTNQSVLSTNANVQITNDFIRDNTNVQNRLTKLSLIVAGASALFAFGSIVTTIVVAKMDDTPKAIQQLKQQLQKQSQIQEQMSQSQKEINKTFQKAVKDSFYQKLQ